MEATETCEDREYRCCEMVTPDEHAESYGYPPSGATRTWEPTRVQRYVIRIEDGAGNRRYVLAADDWSARFVPEKDSAWTFGEREDAETVAAKIQRRYPRWAVEIMGDIR